MKSKNDLMLAKGLLRISIDNEIKDRLDYPKDATFYDWVIVCSYYSIFHSAQSLLGIKRLKIINRMHHATMIAFAKHFIVNDELAEELFLLYEDVEAKASELMDIFEEEKAKRGIYQYHRLSRNNLEPAEESIKNAEIFLKTVQDVLVNKRII
ncbi:hypothetical protein COV93_04790 [Candidatus Woesearchaeota archaeon CG11_big_fil_rev_8_21_14_0_20_43_8]|nr:MAG: hypothetical protein COV93_04790 [Candidatus Woesearchaeota archaeon CG11_big_fil_rev_8_21_14_0_20_43_8]PIO08933.1 MAG: hypothetical protein COT47_00630 [Candidatus Woesearchaeota archaeon CG08_land_8_20_14_0_20_43_7]